MALAKQIIDIPLVAGLNQKAHPLALKPPYLSRCDNVAFDELGALAKRFGHRNLSNPGVNYRILTVGSGSSTDVFVTASIDPSPGALVVLMVRGFDNPGPPSAPTAVGNGLTWEQAATVTHSDGLGGGSRMSFIRTMGNTPTAGAVTITFPGGNPLASAIWVIVELTGVNTSGANGSGAVAQAKTNTTDATVGALTVTFDSAPASSSATLAGFSRGDNSSSSVFTPEAGYTELNPGNSLFSTEFNDASDQTPSGTWSPSDEGASGIALEIVSAPGGTAIAGGGSLGQIRGLAVRDLGDGNEELVALGERVELPGARKVFVFEQGLSSTSGLWHERADYEGVEVTQLVKSQLPQNQYPCDMTAPTNVTHHLVTWLDSETATVRYQVYDQYGMALTPITSTEANSSRPACLDMGQYLHLYWFNSSGDIKLRVIDTADVPNTFDSAAVTLHTAADAAGPYDVVRKNVTEALVAYRRSGGQYAIISVPATGVSPAVTNKAFTTDADSAIGIAYESNLNRVAVVRSDGTDLRGDILNGTSFADVNANVNMASLGGGDLGRVAVAFRPVAESGGTYRAVILYNRTADSSWAKLHYLGTDGATNTLRGFPGSSAGDCAWLRVGGRAFARGRHVYFVCLTTSELVAQQWSCVVYREDGLIVARVGTWSVPDPGSQSSDRTSPLPQSWFDGDDRYGFALAYRGKSTIYDSQFPDSGVKEVVLDWNTWTPYRGVQLGRNLYFPGGYVMVWDGVSAYEAGFFHAITVENILTPTGGALPTGTYKYRLIPEWRYATGEVERGTWVDTETPVPDPATNDKVTFDIHGYPHTLKRGRVKSDGTLSTDIGVLSLKVYRTKVNSSAFFLNSDIDPANSGLTDNKYVKNNPNAQTISYSDNMLDATLGTKERLYTDVTPIDHVSPEACSVAAAGQGRIFLAGHENPQLVTYSKIWQEGEAVAFHDAYQIIVPQDGGRVTALHATESGVLVFSERRVYYVPGVGPDNTGVGSYGEAQLLSAEVGAVRGTQVVQIPGGWMFVSQKGIRLLDRSYAVRDVGAPVVTAALAKVASVDFFATVVSPKRHRVIFICDATDSLVYDYLVDQWSVWTQPVGVAAVVWQGYHVYTTGSSVYAESTDFKQDAGVEYNLDFELAWLDFAGINGFGRCWEMSLLGEWKNTHGLRVRVSYDGINTVVDDQTWAVDTSQYQLRIRPSRQKARSLRVRFTDTDLGTLDDSFKAVALSAVVGVKGRVTRQPTTRSI